ncbi:MAG: aldo/keto reductase [Anaerolineales bacterium]|nr:aldo/keto reductase [Anaerolineales bacterium]
MKDLIQASKVRHFRLSEASANSIRRTHTIQQLTAVQCEYSLWWRSPAAEVLTACEGLGIRFVPYSSLGSGFLTGKIDENTSFSSSDIRRRKHLDETIGATAVELTSDDLGEIAHPLEDHGAGIPLPGGP